MASSCLATLVLWFCGHTSAADSYQVRGSEILKNGQPAQWRGVNVFHVLGFSKPELEAMRAWNIDVVRVIVPNMRDTPLTGEPRQTPAGWLHSFQEIVQAHRAEGRVVILCPFGWDGSQATLCLGKNPSQVPWWRDYLAKYREWAELFKDDPGVWFESWNEPYAWDGKNGYSPALWLSDAQQIADNIRAVAPNNIVVLPCGKMSGDETVVVEKGPELLRGRTNMVFDVHAYNGWLAEPADKISRRLQAVREKNCAMIFAETGDFNAGYDLNPATFLNVASQSGLTVLAWAWKADTHDPNALLDASGRPNEAGKFKWGAMFNTFTRSPHRAFASATTDGSLSPTSP